ncbi:MAG: peptidase E [Clostridiales bacterium]|nr:peptidase E [Clostridiales bacterium]
MKKIIAIGGGELKERETLKIDEYIASLAKERAKKEGKERACALFIPTASHDFMPYYNTFHKVYTGVFNIKTDVALTVFKQTEQEKLKDKFLKADAIYIGGGDTVFMLESWQKSGLLPLILDAYERGVIISGLSAGAICWFKTMFTDSSKEFEGQYSLRQGLGLIQGVMSPHYNERAEEFDRAILDINAPLAYGVEACAALVLEDGEVVGSLTCGGSAYRLKIKDGVIEKEAITAINK